MVDFYVFQDAAGVSMAAAELMLERAQQAVEEHGRFVLALSGGSTPGLLFELLAEEPFRDVFPWEKTFVFWGDDRAVGPEHEWSNYLMAHKKLLSVVPVPESQVFRIQGELGAVRATEVMSADLESVFGTDGIPRFDFLLQGIGGDGHTASLFPGTDALDAQGWVAPVIAPPANPAVDRVTLTFPVLNAARLALFLVVGQGKKDVFNEILSDPEAGSRYPAARVESEETLWFVDEAALGVLS
ncbi:6-phosphogluconolactonase [Pseudodesulfovibrio sp. zrk46]|uniref:6-phosphogluconolactonase n=1 Tax=Pseudodesulfovibrio sp. zrk46 TaxID=2725288 RepID=UPI0014499A82|nr:6-phosphogluconolactonase [Pseudodesulfovibrio sp. zrk46]QJB55639.1 6-phosphogluconolactonase [Pseudodesulfovibrio sp. zrk46]